MSAHRIFVFIDARNERDCIPVAIAEDGTFLAGHYCTLGFQRHDMGLDGSTWKHELYRDHYPDGYELIWVDDPDTDPDCAAAIALNQPEDPPMTRKMAHRPEPENPLLLLLAAVAIVGAAWLLALAWGA